MIEWLGLGLCQFDKTKIKVQLKQEKKGILGWARMHQPKLKGVGANSIQERKQHICKPI